MKIVHLCLASFYIDNYSYQENLLPKYHKISGNDVSIIASLVSFDENGKGCLLTDANSYVNENGIPVTRIEYKKQTGRLGRLLRIYQQDLLVMLEKEKPDIIFIHGIQFWDIKKVKKYAKKYPQVIIYADNHADFSNSAKSFFSKNILHKFIWKHCAKLINPYVTKFYGVLPARVDFLRDVYGIPQEKIELLVMGIDDEKREEVLSSHLREEKRKEYEIKENEVLIVTGGKIDHNKPQTLLLMETINKSEENVKLIVFGSVVPELKERFEEQLSEKVKYIGWKNSEDIYAEFAAGDIVAFPGLHSVLWEQAVGLGKPCIFKEIEGFKHIDLCGNIKYFTIETVSEYQKVIEETVRDIDKMRQAAENEGIKAFSYREIAKKSIN